MTSLEDFVQKWERIPKLYQLVEALDKSEDYEEAFKGRWRNFSEFVQTEHEYLDPETIGLMPAKGVKEQLDFSKEYFEKYRKSSLNYGLRNIDDIVDDLKDKVRDLALGIVPIKETDMDKSDDLDGLIRDYEDKLDTLRENLRNINPQQDRERYQSQERTIGEYEEFASLLRDYKGLVENILGFSQLVGYAKGEGEKGKPNFDKMRNIYLSYLDGLMNKFSGDEDKYEDNLPVIETVRALSRDPNKLSEYYSEQILRPAKRKLDAALQNHNLKDYVKRNVKVMNMTEQIKFFDTVSALASLPREEERDRNMSARFKRLYGW